MSIHLSVGLFARNNLAPAERIFINCDIWVFFENLLRKFRFYLNLTRITGALHEDRYTFVTISRSVLLRMGNVSHESCGEHHKGTHVTFNSNVFRRVKKFRRVSIKLRHDCLSVYSNSAPTGRTFIKFHI